MLSHLNNRCQITLENHPKKLMSITEVPLKNEDTLIQWINCQKVKSALVDVQPNLFKFYDQRILQFKVFPLVWSRSTLKTGKPFLSEKNLSVKFSLKYSGERHCCNLRQLQLWNYLEVWPLSTLANQATGVQVSNCSWMIFVGQALVPPGTWVTVQPRTMLWGLWGGRDARWNADQRRTRIGNTAEQIEPIPD